MGRDALGEFEHMVLLAILRLRDDAYGVPVLEEIRERTGRDVARAAVYIALKRLEEKGFVESWMGEPTPQRGGRAKRYFRVAEAGMDELRESHRALARMREGLEPLLES